VNRVSLGAQTFSSAALTTLGRIHTPADTHRAAEELHAVGLDNFNLDLMYALPQQSVAEALLDVDTALALAPRQISHYQLTLEPNTPFAARPPAGMPEDELADEMFAACAARFAAAGLQRYEVSAHARTGSECRHNLGYWQFGDYLGLGAGAHGKWSWRDRETNSLLVRRSTQARDPRKFGRDPRATLAVRTVAAQELPFEFLLNALRLVAGTTRTTFEATTGLDWQVLAPGIARGFARGLLEGDPETAIRASPRGYAFLNDLLLVMHSD
jgi:oxygen-independent coproporphyrinogen-3 oxidase